MAELADAQASGACGSNIVRVRVPSSAVEESLNPCMVVETFFIYNF